MKGEHEKTEFIYKNLYLNFSYLHSALHLMDYSY